MFVVYHMSAYEYQSSILMYLTIALLIYINVLLLRFVIAYAIQVYDNLKTIVKQIMLRRKLKRCLARSFKGYYIMPALRRSNYLVMRNVGVGVVYERCYALEETKCCVFQFIVK